MPDYAPTTESVRGVYAFTRRGERIRMEREAAFGRWLADRDRHIKAEALREAARDWSDWDALNAPEDWLNGRADRIEANDA